MQPIFDLAALSTVVDPVEMLEYQGIFLLGSDRLAFHAGQPITALFFILSIEV
jgi:hypothetical protein